jgi:hypothetical protein
LPAQDRKSDVFFGKPKALGAGMQGNGIARENGGSAAMIDT